MGCFRSSTPNFDYLLSPIPHLFRSPIQVKSKASQGKGSANGNHASNAKGTSKLSQLMMKEKEGAKARASATPARHSKFNGVFMTTQVCSEGKNTREDNSIYDF